jgi:chromosome segregation ATPase
MIQYIRGKFNAIKLRFNTWYYNKEIPINKPSTTTDNIISNNNNEKLVNAASITDTLTKASTVANKLIDSTELGKANIIIDEQQQEIHYFKLEVKHQYDRIRELEATCATLKTGNDTWQREIIKVTAERDRNLEILEQSKADLLIRTQRNLEDLNKFQKIGEDNEAMEREIAEHKEYRDTLVADVKRLRGELHDAGTIVKKLLVDVKSKQATLDKTIQDNTVESMKVKVEIMTLKRELANVVQHNDILSSQIKAKEMQANPLAKEVEQLKEQLRQSAIELNNKKEEFNTHIAKTKNNNSNVDTQRKDKLAEIEAKLEEGLNSNTELMNSLKKLSAENLSLTAINSKLTEEVDTYRHKISVDTATIANKISMQTNDLYIKNEFITTNYNIVEQIVNELDVLKANTDKLYHLKENLLHLEAQSQHLLAFSDVSQDTGTHKKDYKALKEEVKAEIEKVSTVCQNTNKSLISLTTKINVNVDHFNNQREQINIQLKDAAEKLKQELITPTLPLMQQIQQESPAYNLDSRKYIKLISSPISEPDSNKKLTGKSTVTNDDNKIQSAVEFFNNQPSRSSITSNKTTIVKPVSESSANKEPNTMTKEKVILKPISALSTNMPSSTITNTSYESKSKLDFKPYNIPEPTSDSKIPQVNRTNLAITPRKHPEVVVVNQLSKTLSPVPTPLVTDNPIKSDNKVVNDLE